MRVCTVRVRCECVHVFVGVEEEEKRRRRRGGGEGGEGGEGGRQVYSKQRQ